MKPKLLLFQIPFVIFFAAAYYVGELGNKGQLESRFLRERVFPQVRRFSTVFTDLKFRARGPRAPKSPIVIVAIDNLAIDTLGRWPWHRDVTGALVDRIFSYGAKVVGLDMVFSESDPRVSEEMGARLRKAGMDRLVQEAETDPVLMRVIASHTDSLVMGWAYDNLCQPAYQGQDCLTDLETRKDWVPEGYEKFAFSKVNYTVPFKLLESPFLSVTSPLLNINMYNEVGLHAGEFEATPDPDGYIRRTPLFAYMKGRFYPTLTLEMARAGLKQDLVLGLDKDQRVAEIGFDGGRKIDTTPLGVMEVNFRGPSETYKYVSAAEILTKGDSLENSNYRGLAGLTKTELLKDAYVLVGPTAIGIYDMRAYPFDSNTPGVEGHANILDNILSGDWFIPSSKTREATWLLLLMTLGAIAFAFGCEKLEAIPALALFLLCFSGMAFVDLKVLFAKNMNWNTSFFYTEILAIFMFTLAVKYVLEERNKKFIRGAFAKYVAPAVVDSILKDPAKLSVGGEKKDLTILFSDIRSFTTFSEQMDAKMLASFLNEYLGIMTDIVFDHNGTLDKYIGDAIMAFWGAPLDQPNHAINACNAALAMKKALADNKQKWLTKYGINVNIGIGVNSGVVNVGNMGCERSFEYTVIGDHVNLASRLEGLTKAYGTTIATTRFTFDNIVKSGNQAPSHRVLDSVKVKGKKNAVELIELLAEGSPADGLTAFGEARDLYRAQKWDEAIAKFQVANTFLRPSPEKMDGPCETFIERCEYFKANPPYQGWDGSWEMDSK